MTFSDEFLEAYQGAWENHLHPPVPEAPVPAPPTTEEQLAMIAGRLVTVLHDSHVTPIRTVETYGTKTVKRGLVTRRVHEVPVKKGSFDVFPIREELVKAATHLHRMIGLTADAKLVHFNGGITKDEFTHGVNKNFNSGFGKTGIATRVNPDVRPRILQAYEADANDRFEPQFAIIPFSGNKRHYQQRFDSAEKIGYLLIDAAIRYEISPDRVFRP